MPIKHKNERIHWFLARNVRKERECLHKKLALMTTAKKIQNLTTLQPQVLARYKTTNFLRKLPLAVV